MGRVTQYVYDSRNRQIATINPDGSVVRTEYDGGGRVVATTDANANTTTYTYDQLGRKLIGHTARPGWQRAATATTTYAYLDATDVQTVTNATGNTTETDYDKLGRVIKVIQPARPRGRASRRRSPPMTPTEMSRRSPIPSAMLPRTIMTRNRRSPRRMPSATIPGTITTTTAILFTSLMPTGQPVTTQPILFQVCRTTEMTRRSTSTTIGGVRSKKIDPSPGRPGGGLLHETMQYAYNASGNLASTTDPDGNTSSFVYNLEGQQTETIDALGDVTTTVYDAVGNVLSITNASGIFNVFPVRHDEPQDRFHLPLSVLGRGASFKLPSPACGRGAGGEGFVRPW